ncbi:MAG: class I SAM-dependent methyltransferase [Candidatus Xenobia bacterium]
MSELLKNIVNLSRDLDGDLKAMGPHTPAEVQGHLETAARALEQALAATRARRSGYVQEQMQRLGLSAESRHLKVQLGGGSKEVAGWINVDFHPGQLALNVRWGLPFADGSVDYLYFSHMLEHFYFRFEVLPLLQEVRRVLSPQGVIRAVVPDIGACVDAYARSTPAFFTDRRKVWKWAQFCVTPLEHFLEYAGANQYDASFASHKFGYDFATLAALLSMAGFSRLTRSHYMGSRHPELTLDHLSTFAGASSDGTPYSLFVEDMP